MSMQQDIRLQTENTENMLQSIGLPAFVMSLYFWLMWVNPIYFGDNAALGCSVILLSEFLAIHSTAFIVSKVKGHQQYWFFSIYILTITGVAIATGSIWPVAFFAWHIYDTTRAFRTASESQTRMLAARWIISGVLFILAVFAAIFIPFPDLGWHPGIVSDSLAWTEEGTGRKNYHATPAWGMIYFFAMGMMSLYWPVISKNIEQIQAQNKPSDIDQ